MEDGGERAALEGPGGRMWHFVRRGRRDGEVRRLVVPAVVGVGAVQPPPPPIVTPAEAGVSFWPDDGASRSEVPTFAAQWR